MKYYSIIVACLIAILGSTFDYVVAFTINAIPISNHQHPAIHHDDYLYTRHLSSSDFRLHAASDLIGPTLITIGFAAASIYTYQNPDTSDRIRQAWEEYIESSMSNTTTTATTDVVTKNPDVKVTEKKEAVEVRKTTPAPVASTSVAPVTKSSPQQELTSLLKEVSESVDEQSTKLDELKSKRQVTKSGLEPAVEPSPSVVQEMKGGKKRRFVGKVFKKIVMPWKAWNKL